MADRIVSTFQKDVRRRGTPRRFRLRKDIASAGDVLQERGTSSLRFFGPTVELQVPISDDQVIYVLADLDDVLDNPQVFEEVDEDDAPLPDRPRFEEPRRAVRP